MKPTFIEAKARIEVLTANTARNSELVPVEQIKVGDALTGLWDARCPVVKVARHRDGSVSITTFSSYSRGKVTVCYPKGDALYVFPAC